MAFQSQLDEISALLFSQGLRDNRFAADNWLPHLKKELGYSPLKDSEIRLLRILPRSVCDDIQFTLEHFQCDSSHRCTQTYRALSYCWGDATDTAAIIVNDCRLSITRALEAAIRELRRHGYDYVWIDAICINQGDKNERGHQILKMRDIYYNAYETIVWLGEENKYTREALSIFDCLATRHPGDLFRMRTKQLLINKPDELKKLSGWTSVAALLALPYWQRTWVIQEMAMSRNTILLWGSHAITIQTIALAIKTLREHSPTIWFYFTGIEHIQGLLGIIDGINDRRGNKRREPIAAEDLLTVLCCSCLSRASEPRDKNFGVLGLAHDGANTIPEPNYLEPMDSILRRITLKKLTGVCREQVVDIICLNHGARPKRADLPFWVVDWAVLWETADGNIWSSLTLRYLSTTFETCYKACGGSSASVQISSNDLILTCRGYTFDVIRGLSKIERQAASWLEAPVKGRATASTLENEVSVLHNVYGSEPELSEAIWVSAVHDPLIPGAAGDAASIAHAFQGLFSADARKPWWVEERWMEVIKDTREFKIYGRTLKDWSTRSEKYPNSTIQALTVQIQKTQIQLNAISGTRFKSAGFTEE